MPNTAFSCGTARLANVAGMKFHAATHPAASVLEKNRRWLLATTENLAKPSCEPAENWSEAIDLAQAAAARETMLLLERWQHPAGPELESLIGLVRGTLETNYSTVHSHASICSTRIGELRNWLSERDWNPRRMPEPDPRGRRLSPQS